MKPFSPGDIITFHQKPSDDRNIVRVVCKVEGNSAIVSGINGHTFDVNTGNSDCGKNSLIRCVAFEDAVDLIMRHPSTIHCGRDRVSSELKERTLAFKVNELISTK